MVYVKEVGWMDGWVHWMGGWIGCVGKVGIEVESSTLSSVISITFELQDACVCV